MAEKFARPYVDALFDIAGSAEAVEALLPGLEALAEAIKTREDLRQLLANPKVSRSAKSAVLLELGKKAGLNDVGGRLLVVLHANKRLFSLEAILKAIRQRLDSDRNVIEAFVESAVPLTETAKKRLVEVLGKKTGCQVRLHAAVKAEVLGGLVIRVGSEIYDSSVALRLEKVRQSLLAVS